MELSASLIIEHRNTSYVKVKEEDVPHSTVLGTEGIKIEPDQNESEMKYSPALITINETEPEIKFKSEKYGNADRGKYSIAHQYVLPKKTECTKEIVIETKRVSEYELGNLAIKNEEIVIKPDEEDKFNTSACIFLGKNEESMVLQCDQCNYRFEWKNNLEFPDEVKCDRCHFGIPCPRSFSEQNVTRENPKMFSPEVANQLESEICNLETVNKNRLQKLHFRHERMFKCRYCGYQAATKNDLTKHIRAKHKEHLTHFQCSYCDYRTIYKAHLAGHDLIHRKPGEVETFKCPYCDFQTIYERGIKRHIIVHKDPDEIEMFQCGRCIFQTIHKASLKTHLSLHEDPKEIIKCNYAHCNFETGRKRALKFHLRCHIDRENCKKFTCEHCDFQSIYKSSVFNHSKRHKEAKEVEPFKCFHCNYETKYKNSLISHVLKHKDPTKIVKFKCTHCDFESIRKRSFQAHSLVHKDPKDCQIYKCLLCDFQTIYKASLKPHSKRQHGKDTSS